MLDAEFTRLFLCRFIWFIEEVRCRTLKWFLSRLNCSSSSQNSDLAGDWNILPVEFEQVSSERNQAVIRVGHILKASVFQVNKVSFMMWSNSSVWAKRIGLSSEFGSHEICTASRFELSELCSWFQFCGNKMERNCNVEFGNFSVNFSYGDIKPMASLCVKNWCLKFFNTAGQCYWELKRA